MSATPDLRQLNKTGITYHIEASSEVRHDQAGPVKDETIGILVPKQNKTT